MGLNNIWGYDTETVEKNGGGQPYTFQLTCGDIQLFHEQKDLNPVHFRNVFLGTVGRYCEDGDALFSYNLFFENQVLFRDRLFLFSQNRIDIKFGDCRIRGVLEEPTPFLSLTYGEGTRKQKTIWIIDSAKYFGGDTGQTLEVVAKEFLPMRKLKRPPYLGKRKPFSYEKKSFKNYAMVDSLLTESLGGIIKKYHNEAGLDKWCFSVAHLAGQFFNKDFCEGRKLDLAHPVIEGGAMWSRFGGYRRGWVPSGIYENFVHLDLKSAYPWAYSNIRAYFKGAYYDSRKIPNDGEGIYKIDTVLPRNDIRPLFQRRGKNNRIETQPLNKRIQFWTTGLEILAYKKIWGKEWDYKILKGYEWKGQNKYKPLKAWADYAFKIKESAKGDKSDWRYNFGKALANHITGKFDSSLKMNKEEWLTPQGLITIQDIRPGSLRNLFVASIIRGKVRARVWAESRYNQKFPPEPSIQEMTDSMDIPEKNLKHFKISDKLGGWGIECKGTLIFHRTGSYLYYDKGKFPKVAFHGIQFRNPKTGKFDPVSFLKFVGKGAGIYYRVRMVRARESLRVDRGKSALRFRPKKFNLKIPKNFIKEVAQWLKRKRL